MGNLVSLGGVLPLVNQGLSSARTLSRLGRLGGGIDRLRLGQLQERNRLDEQIAEGRADRDRAILGAEQSEQERRRTSALRRAVSRQRAAYGGAGVDGDSGSGEAVLLGLFNESEQERAAGENIFNLRNQILNDNLANLRRRNLLEESQLAQRLRRGR